jgi:hypothetical protein
MHLGFAGCRAPWPPRRGTGPARAADHLLGGRIGLGHASPVLGLDGGQSSVEVFRHAVRARELLHQQGLLGGFGEFQRQVPARHLLVRPRGQARRVIDPGPHAHLQIEPDQGSAVGGVVGPPAKFGHALGHESALEGAAGRAALRVDARALIRAHARRTDAFAGPVVARRSRVVAGARPGKPAAGAASGTGRSAGEAPRADRVRVHSGALRGSRLRRSARKGRCKASRGRRPRPLAARSAATGRTAAFCARGRARCARAAPGL